MDSLLLRKIQNKIRKLLALGRSPHPEEASSALAKAEDLRKRYGLAALPEYEEHPFFEQELVLGTEIPEWRKALAGVVASVRQVDAMLYTTGTDPGIRLRGTEERIQRAEKLFEYLDTKIMEISPKYVSVVRDIEGFRLGMVAGIEERLESEERKTGPEERQVVLSDLPATDFSEAEEPVISGRADPDSYGLGRAIGRKIPQPA